jgi:hypothetical protein
MAADAGFADYCEDPGAFIVRACAQAETLLRKALEAGDIDQVAEVKSQAEAVRARAMQMRLEKDALLAVTGFLRRAERGLGLAIRRGQEAGTIRGPHNGRQRPRPGVTPMRLVTEFSSIHDLAGGGKRDNSQVGIYALTDGISDENFEAALTEARTEGNLSRANVARKARARTADVGSGREWIPGSGEYHGEAPAQRRRLIRKWARQGHSSRQIAELLGMGAEGEGVRRIARNAGIAIPADAFVGGSRHLDSNRIVRETVHSLEGLAMGIELADPAALDPAEAGEWAASLTSSIRVLSRFARKMKETTHG